MEENITPSLDSIPQVNKEMISQSPTVGGVLNTAAFDPVQLLMPPDSVRQGMPMPSKYVPEKIRVDTPKTTENIAEDIANSFTSAVKSLQPKAASEKYGATHAYDADYTGVFYDRYADMTNVFDKYGFSPWRDNEKLYNDNSSWLDRFKRSASNSMSLAGISFKGALPWNAWSSDISKDDAVAQERAFGRGYDSKGGFGSFMNNQVLNSGFTVGMLAEFGAESIVEGAASLLLAPESAGASLLGFADIARKGYKTGKAIIQGGLDVAKMGERLNQTAKAMKDINLSRKFFDVVNAERLGKALTPNVVDEIKEIQRMSKAGNDLTELAKVSRTVGAFYKDVRIASGSVSESKMEAGSVELKIRDDLTNKFFHENGKMPDEVEQAKMAKKAHEGAMSTFWYNLPAIYLSNKIVFDKAFSSMKPLRASADEMANVTRRYGIEKTAEGVFKEYGTGVRETLGRATKKAFWEPKNLGKNVLVGLAKYTKANVTEGLQEQYQEGVSDAFTRYYEDLYFDPAHAGSKLSYLSSGMGRQFTTEQGWETFASGFMMGGMMQGPQYLAFVKGKDLIQSTFKKEKYNAAKESEKNMVADMVTALNQTDDFIKRYSKGEDLNASLQIRNARNLAKATVNQDKKAYMDIVDDSLANHFYTLAASGKMSVIKDQIKDYQSMSPEEQIQAFGVGETKTKKEKISERLNQMAQLADDIQERYQVVDEEFVNPFNPLRYDPKKEMAQYMQELSNKQSFEEAKKWAVTSSYHYDNTVKRLQSIYNKAANTPVVGALANDFQVLYNTDKAMNKELETLNAEIDAATGITLPKSDRSDISYKKKKAKYLDAYINAKAFYSDAMQSGDEKKIDNAISDLYKAYGKYTNAIAENVGSPVFNRKLLSSFMNVVDFYKLGEEKGHLAQAVNFLNNPEGIGYMTARISKITSNIASKREAELTKALKAFRQQVVLNKTLNGLLDIGVFIDKPEMDDLLAGKPVTKFYEVGDEHNALLETSDKYPKAMEIVTAYRVEKGFITPEEIQAHNAKVAQEHEAATVATPQPATKETEQPADSKQIEQFNKAKKGALERIKESADPQKIFSEINRLQEALKYTKGSELTLEEQAFIDEKLKELKDKGYTFKTKKGTVTHEGEMLTEHPTFLELNEITEEQKELLKKELDRRKKVKQKLIDNGYTEKDAINQAGLNPQDTISIVSNDVKVAVYKNDVLEKSGEVNTDFTDVKNAEIAALETPKEEQTNKEDYNLLRKKHFSHQMIETLTPQEREEIFKSFADPNVTDLTPTDILNRREAVKKAQEANEKKAKEKSYEKLTEVLVAEAKELKNRVGYEEFMDKIKGYKTDSYDLKALEEVLEVKRQEYKDQEYAEKQVTFDKIKTGDLVYLHNKKAKGKMYVIIKDEKNKSFKYYLHGASANTAGQEFPAEDTPRIIAKTASMEETKIEPVTPEAKEAANENVKNINDTSAAELEKIANEAKGKNSKELFKNINNKKGC